MTNKPHIKTMVLVLIRSAEMTGSYFFEVSVHVNFPMNATRYYDYQFYGLNWDEKM